LIHSNAHFQKRWDALSDADRENFGRGHFALSDELAASGELVVSEGLLAVHDEATTAAGTDWPQILGLYDVHVLLAPGSDGRA
jgi:predicted RNA polymerase sigma factor